MTARLLGISGSLRRGSFSTAILVGLREAVAAEAELLIHPLNDLPLYNGDEDVQPALPPVAALREAIRDADGIVIASPEYNHGLSGVIKNALDWASRPFGQSTLTGKAVLTVTSSPAFTGGVRAHAQLNETLHSIGARVLLRPQAVIGQVHEKVKDGRLVDPGSLEFLRAGVRDLLKEIAVTPAVCIEGS